MNTYTFPISGCAYAHACLLAQLKVSHWCLPSVNVNVTVTSWLACGEIQNQITNPGIRWHTRYLLNLIYSSRAIAACYTHIDNVTSWPACEGSNTKYQSRDFVDFHPMHAGRQTQYHFYSFILFIHSFYSFIHSVLLLFVSRIPSLYVEKPMDQTD